ENARNRNGCCSLASTQFARLREKPFLWRKLAELLSDAHCLTKQTFQIVTPLVKRQRNDFGKEAQDKTSSVQVRTSTNQHVGRRSQQMPKSLSWQTVALEANSSLTRLFLQGFVTVQGKPLPRCLPVYQRYALIYAK
ncbi:hypothetical protein J4Q44_G00301500, partial [Coregonus suidteri]